MEENILAVAVVHTLPPDHKEWSARLDRSAEAFRAGHVCFIIVTGGRDGLNGYNNPQLMEEYLVKKGVPLQCIKRRSIQDDEVGTPENTVDTADEVRDAIRLIAENGWQKTIIRPVSNNVHIWRILKIYRARARKMRFKLNLKSLPINNLLGRKWAIMEIVLMRSYTLFDPSWEGPVAEWMRKKRRAGMKFGIAGGSPGSS